MEEISDVDVQGTETQPDSSETDAGVSGSEFTIPDEYKEKGWTKNLKSYDDLWKMNDNAQSMIGKKTIGVPSDESTDQEWSDYYAKIRPENAEAYKVDLEGDDKALFEKLFYENGINTRQAKALVEGYKQSVAQAEEAMKSQEGYQQELTNRFGDKAEAVAKSVAEFISKEASKEDKAALEAMPNNVIGVIYSLMNKVQERYAVKDSDKGITAKGGVTSNQPDWDGYIKAAQELDSRPHSTSDLNELRDRFHIPYK